MSRFSPCSLALALAVAAGCKPAPAPSAPASAPSAPASAPAAPAPAVKAPAADAPAKTREEADRALAEVLATYEQVRAQLAADDVSGLEARATALARSAANAGAGLSAPLVDPASALALAGARLAAARPQDLKTVRPVFGELSRALVALLVAEPKLREGRRVMHCPMVESGYQKWVQVPAGVSNPYYGSEMLECGGESTWD